MKELKPRDKVTQRMSRNGLIADNQTTGEAQRISGREAEKALTKDEQPVNLRREDDEAEEKQIRQQRPAQGAQPNPAEIQPGARQPVPIAPEAATPHKGGTAGKLYDRAAAEHSAHSARKAAHRANDTIREGDAVKGRPSSRLQFTDEERNTPELQPYIRRSDSRADKLDAARDAIPKKRTVVKERVFDDASGKGKTKLHFEKVDKDPPKLKQSPLSRPATELVMFVHGKIHEVEKDNAGVESGHKGEELAERGAGSAIRWEKRRRKMKPYRAAKKAEKKALNANAEYFYQKALHDNPQLAESNPLSRFIQKRHI